MDAQTVDWGMWWVKTFVMALMALGIVKVMDLWEWWATRKTRRVMVQCMVTPGDVDDEGESGQLKVAAMADELWEDCPVLNAHNLAFHQQNFPNARYRLVRLGEED